MPGSPRCALPLCEPLRCDVQVSVESQATELDGKSEVCHKLALHQTSTQRKGHVTLDKPSEACSVWLQAAATTVRSQWRQNGAETIEASMHGAHFPTIAEPMLLGHIPGHWRDREI